MFHTQKTIRWTWWISRYQGTDWLVDCLDRQWWKSLEPATVGLQRVPGKKRPNLTKPNLSTISYLKSTWQSMNRKSGNCIRNVLCIGVKWMTASAVILYWSRVHRVLSSQIFFSGHHIAWSDQSMAISEKVNRVLN